MAGVVWLDPPDAKSSTMACSNPASLNASDRAACDRRFAASSARAAGPRGPRQLSRAEARREEGFAEQAAANEAWRKYRRSEDPGSYPGLRSMLKHF